MLEVLPRLKSVSQRPRSSFPIPMNLVSLADTDAEACESYGVPLDCEVDGNGKKRCLQRPTAIVD
jgi:hypothetical protein